MRHRMRTMRTRFKQYRTRRPVPFGLSIINMTLHILVGHQLVRFGVYVQPRNFWIEQLAIVQLISNPCDAVFGSSDEECQVQQAELDVNNGRPEISRQRRFRHRSSQSLDGSLVGRRARTTVEDNGTESLAADVLWQAANELDGALRAAVGEDM